MASTSPTKLVQVVRENVRRLRHEQGVTQEQLADKAGVSRTYIGYLESQGKNVTLEVLEKFSRAFDVDARELLRPSHEWRDQ